jgi:hypothetical protein
MKTPMQEAIAQLMFWSGMGCFPFSILIFVAAFRLKEKWKALVMCAVGSIVVTHFLWYFMYLGKGLAAKVGEFHPTPWWHVYPVGFCVAAVLATISVVRRSRLLTQANEDTMSPPLPRYRGGHSVGEG